MIMKQIFAGKKQNVSDFESVLKGDLLVENTLKYSVGSIKIDDTVVTVFACEDFWQSVNYRGEVREISLGGCRDLYEEKQMPSLFVYADKKNFGKRTH